MKDGEARRRMACAAITPDEDDRLTRVAESLGRSKSSLIRQALADAMSGWADEMLDRDAVLDALRAHRKATTDAHGNRRVVVHDRDEARAIIEGMIFDHRRTEEV